LFAGSILERGRLRAALRSAAGIALMESASSQLAAAPTPILSVSRLHKQYQTTVAVDDISFTVAAHEILGLLGPNGAGKTTTINMILGILEPTSGVIAIDGCNLARHRREALAKTNFAAVYAPLPGNLTVAQNLRVFGMLYSVRGLSERIETVLREFDLLAFRNTKCGVLSSGEQTRVALAKSMLNEPRLLLLDEPTASLDPAVARDIRRTIQEFAARTGVGVLWTSHNMLEVADVCHRVLFLSRGKILLEGDPRTLPAAHGRNTLEDLFVAVAREPLTIRTGGDEA
jgi:ABC-2 type transport system ATP-binding protein